jgi:Putative beta-barrel porin-2, OmpL-like. bbp2
VEELEKQIVSLQTQLAEVKKELGSSTPAAPAAAAAVAVPAASPAAQPMQPVQDQAAAPSSSPMETLLGKTTLSGFVDGYYSYNFGHPPGQVNPIRAFDTTDNQFSLNMIELILDKPAEDKSPLGYHLAFGYGNAMNAVNGTDPAGLGFAQYLKEGYFSYLAPVGKGLQIDFGKFVTPHGAEVIESKDNWNYTRGILFTWAIPFYHYGVRAKYAFSDKVSVSGFVVNGWNSIVDNNTGKTLGVQLAWNPTKRISIIQNYMGGPEQAAINNIWRHLSDTLLTVTATDKLSFMFNYDYGHDRFAIANIPARWSGIAGYIRYGLNDANTIVARYEYYNDKDGFTTGTTQHLQEVTGTYEHVIAKHLQTRFEYRHDFSNQPTFFKGLSPSMGQDTVAVGLMYSFDSKESN